jgi:Flp pilus assembly protein TadG
MKIKKFFSKKKPAQAMVEFAIALPVLLMLLYGILEAGRYLFIYSSIVTASRQAVRYASATGEGLTTTAARYDDCDGIRQAAKRVDYLNTFTTADIKIYHDEGPNPPSTIGKNEQEYCKNISADGWSPTSNKYRIVVKIQGNFNPIIPKLVPFITRSVANGNPIRAEAARSLLYSVPIVVEQAPVIVPQSPVDVTITVSPEPSDIGQQVTIKVTVTDHDDPTNTPSGTVEITGVDGCSPNPIALVNGMGTCTVSFADAGDFPLAAIYTPNDEDHLPNQGTTTHHVNLAQTTTQIIAVSPEPSIAGNNNPVFVSVTVTGGSTTPSGTVNIDGGGGKSSCTVNLVGGAGSCPIYFNNSGLKTINATYIGDTSHQGSTATPVGHEVLDVTPTPRATSTITPIPSATATATATLSPTPMATPLASCKGITHGPIKYSGNNMTMTVTNPFPFALTMSNVTVTWNNDKGHKTGSDKTLKLIAGWVNGTPFWSGTSSANESTKTLLGPASFPSGTSIITFTFDKSYDIPLLSDRILINWLTPGCEGDAVDSSH